MDLTKCEGDQLIEATRLWFARTGGVIDLKIKSVTTTHAHETSVDIMPPGFSKHEPTKEVLKW